MKLRMMQFVSIFLLILVTGIFWGTWFSLSRSIDSISPASFLENSHIIIGNLTGTMRILFPAALLSTLGLLVELFRQSSRHRLGRSFFLTLSGYLLFIAALVVTLVVNVPIDNQFRQWSISSVPGDWEQLRDRWQLFHTIRTFSALGGLAFILAGALWSDNEK